MGRSLVPRVTTGIYIADEDLPKVVRALDHYAAYMRATKRDDRDYAELAAALQSEPMGCCSPIIALLCAKPN